MVNPVQRTPWSNMQAHRLIMSITALLVVAGCSSQRPQETAARKPAEVKAQIVRLLPAKTVDRQGWATDIYAAFAAQNIAPTTQNLCSVLAVTEQESTFQVDPGVPACTSASRICSVIRRATSSRCTASPISMPVGTPVAMLASRTP